MTQATWEKSAQTSANQVRSKRSDRWKFMLGGMLILGAAIYLIVANTVGGARYFITVDELLGDSSYIGETVRISGAVIGESIAYDTSDPAKPVIEFNISHIDPDAPDLALALHESVKNPTLNRLPIRVENQAMPDLLQNEAQAILSGYLGEDGVFHANELLLKCPSRFEEALPDQSIAGEA
jgi:cytochrome c-type biogenesis protein CcmE